MPRDCVHLWTMLTVQTISEEPGPRNKDETGHWPFSEMSDKTLRGWGCMKGVLVLRGGALVPKGYPIMPLKRMCHVVIWDF